MANNVSENPESYDYAYDYKSYNCCSPSLIICKPNPKYSHQFFDCYQIPVNTGPCDNGICLGCDKRCNCGCKGGTKSGDGNSPPPSAFVPVADLIVADYPLDNSGGCSREAVNLMNGNMTIHYPVCSFPTIGYPLDYSITYNSRREDSLKYGFRWISDIERKAIKTIEDGNTYIEITTGTGREYRYQYKSGEYVLDDYIDPATNKGTASNWMNMSLSEEEDYYVESTTFGKKIYYLKSTGRMDKVADLSGNEIYYKFTTRNDELTSVKDHGEGEEKRQVTIEYDEGKVNKVTDPYGRITQFFYTGPYLTQVVGPDGCVTSFQYDQNGRVKSKTDPNGGIATYSYDSKGRLVSTINSLSQTTTFEYDFVLDDLENFKADTKVTDPDGKLWTWKFNQSMLLSEVVDPESNRTAFVWNGEMLVRVVEGMVSEKIGNDYYYVAGSIHSFIYDENDRIITYIDPVGRGVSLTYDSKGDITKVEECAIAWHVRGNFEESFGQDGFLLCAFDNETDPEDFQDVIDLPDYVDSITYDNDVVVRVCEDLYTDDSCVLYDGDRRFCRWYIASGSSALDSFDINISMSQDKEFALGVYCQGFHPEENVPGYPLSNWFERKITFQVTDAEGTKEHTVENTFSGVWTSFPVTGASGSDITLTLSIDLDVTPDIALSALAFDPPRVARMKYEYDSQRNLVKTIDAEDNEAVNTYSSDGLLEIAADFENNETEFKYDQFGNVVNITEPVGTGGVTALTTLSYDETAHADVIEATDPDGRKTRFEYDNVRRLTKITFPGGQFIQYYYDNMDNITKIRGSSGRDLVKYTYDLMGRVTKKTYSTGAEVRYQYNSVGAVTTVTDPRGNETSYQYYDNRWLKKIISPLGNETLFEYNASGDLVKVTLPDGGVIGYEYFLDHTLKQVTLPNETTSLMEPDYYGDIKYIQDAKGNKAQFKYDMLRQLDESIRSLNSVEKITSYVYNKNGQVTQVTDARGNSTNFTYDKAGNVIRIDYPDGTHEEFLYDPAGRLIRHTDGKGRSTGFQYDSDGRVTQVIRADGSTVNYSFDSYGRIISRSDHFPPSGDVENQQPDTVTSYRYDSQGRLILVTKKDASGKTLYRHRTAYDFTNLVTDFDDIFGPYYGDGWKYGEGNIIDGADGIQYDHVYKFGQFRYGPGEYGPKYGEYVLGTPAPIPPDRGGNVEGRIKYGMGAKESDFQYDSLSRLTQYTDFFGNNFYYGYDRYGRLSLVRYPNNIITTYQFDLMSRLSALRHEKMNPDGSRDTLEQFTYQYDPNGNITKITSYDGTYMEYTYDDWNRLTKEEKKDSGDATVYEIEYAYDDTGNITGKTKTLAGGSPETTTFAYDSYNKLTGITYPDSATETLSYNDNGQLIKREKSTGEVTQYQWNDQGFLTRVILPTGEPVEYRYDGAGRLIARRDAEGEDVFVQSGWNIITEQDQSKNRTYYTGRSAVKPNDSPLYFHYDHRGNTRLITDDDGNVIKQLSYEAYGTPIDSHATPINDLSLKAYPNLFVGKHGIKHDGKTNLDYMRFRWYSPGDMRFISADLLQDTNRYAYVRGNPVRRIDSFGLKWYGFDNSNNNTPYDPNIEDFIYSYEFYNLINNPYIDLLDFNIDILESPHIMPGLNPYPIKKYRSKPLNFEDIERFIKYINKYRCKNPYAFYLYLMTPVGGIGHQYVWNPETHRYDPVLVFLTGFGTPGINYGVSPDIIGDYPDGYSGWALTASANYYIGYDSTSGETASTNGLSLGNPGFFIGAAYYLTPESSVDLIYNNWFLRLIQENKPMWEEPSPEVKKAIRNNASNFHRCP